MVNLKKENYKVNQIQSLYNVKNSTEFWKIINSFRINKNTQTDFISPETWFDHLVNLFPPANPSPQCITLKISNEFLDKNMTLLETQPYKT